MIPKDGNGQLNPLLQGRLYHYAAIMASATHNCPRPCLPLLPLTSVIRRQHVAVRVDHVIDKVPDLIDIQFRCRVGVHHSGMVDMLALAGQRRLDGQSLDVDLRGRPGWCRRWRLT